MLDSYLPPDSVGWNCSYFTVHNLHGVNGYKECFINNCGSKLTITNCPSAGGGMCFGNTAGGLYLNGKEVMFQSDSGLNCGTCNYLTYEPPASLKGCYRYQFRESCDSLETCGGIFTVYGGIPDVPTHSVAAETASITNVPVENHMQLQAVHSPTGQPTGVPTQQPTSFPTIPLESVISVNISHTFREVSAAKFNRQMRKCVHALADALAEILELQPRKCLLVHKKAEEYFNQIFDYDFMTIRENLHAQDFMSLKNLSGYRNYTGPQGIGPVAGQYRRRLGQTHGSIGSTLHYTLFIHPGHLGLTNTDEAYWNTRHDLLESLERQVFTDVVRVKAAATGCASLAAIEGSTLTYFSEFYQAAVTHSVPPTSVPTVHPRVRRAYNFAGIMSGTIVGITAFIVVGMVLLQFKYTLGFDKPSDRFVDEPAIDL